MDYSTLPLSSGEAAIHEAGLLAQALVGCQPVRLETQLAVRREVIAKEIQVGIGVTHLHVLWNGRDIGERWIVLRDDESAGTHVHDDAPQGAVDAQALTVDIGDGPAKGRLSRLLSVIDPTGADRELTPLRNALAVCRRAELGESEPALLSLATELTDKYLVPILIEGTPEWLEAITEMPRQPGLVLDYLARCRSEWSIDALAAAAMLVVGSLPRYCAEAESAVGSPTTSVAVFITCLKRTIGGLIMQDPYAVFAAAGQAVDDGYRDAVEALASDFHATALAHRDAALDGPPDRMQFGGQLADAAVFALAAYLVARQLAPGQPMNQRATSANELYVRACDGLVFQWTDWISGDIVAWRDDYLAAVARGDKIAAWKVIRGGEQRLRWPRSIKDLFASSPKAS